MNGLKKDLEEYLAIRRALGYELRRYEIPLGNFVAFLGEKQAHYITLKLALDWAKQSSSDHPKTWARRLSMIRGFAKHMTAIDSRTEIPPLGLFSNQPKRKCLPYIYADDEVHSLLHDARKLRPTDGMRPWTYSTIFGLLWATGMRISEVLNLDRSDVDLSAGLLKIRNTKFGKSRFVPIHATTQTALQSYASRRDQIFPSARTSAFFLTSVATRPTREVVNMTFLQLSRQIGLRTADASSGPRIHDMRHSFIVRSLVNLYKRKISDLDRQVYTLSVYVGHVDPSTTYWYMTAVPELLSLARQRIEQKQGVI
ncbi:MAG TPA: integrase [Gammaproteobacteria bacterium]|nr:integrase [Gammaproteobacteria bacterium]